MRIRNWSSIFLLVQLMICFPYTGSSSDNCHDEQDILIAAGAELIVIGTIERRTNKEDGVTYWGHIYADIDLRVEESIKGTPSHKHLRILSPGGVLTDQQTGEMRISDFGPYDFSSYRVGDRVLVFLVYVPSLGAYEVVRHYFKLVNHVVVGGSSFHNPSLLNGVVTEERLKATVLSLVTCTSPNSLVAGAEMVIAASFISDDGDFNPEMPGWGRLKTLQVNEVLKGSLQEQIIQVVIYRFNEVRWQPGQRLIVFLKRTDAGHVELFRSFAGWFELSEGMAIGKVQSFSVNQLRALIDREHKD